MLKKFFSAETPLLVTVASGGETSVVLRAIGASAPEMQDWEVEHCDSFSVLQTGVGKSNAAGAVARELSSGQKTHRAYVAVLSIGIAGSLRADVEIGSVVFGEESNFADEGVPFVNDREWTSLQESGWAQIKFPCSDTPWSRHLKTLCDHSGPITTISTISGTDEIASQYVARSQAIAEGMEGAAIAQVCSRFGVPFAELRVISNRCGNRNVNKLDIPTSFKRLAALIAQLELKA